MQGSPVTLGTVEEMASRKDTTTARDDQQFRRFLEAADNLGSHLAMVFESAFVKIVPTTREFSPESENRRETESASSAREEYDVSQFACDECGCPSITLPAKFDDDSEVCCRRCNKFLMKWGQFKLRCQQAPNLRVLPHD
jgi:Asp-tRNA(Asn)/Glu-tRNA(Gln) amidotransferase A subunit family amidase